MMNGLRERKKEESVTKENVKKKNKLGCVVVGMASKSV
jgi:hypothetical protein